VTKRKLNKQQQSRVDKKRATLPEAESTRRDASHFGGLQPGLVVSHYRDAAEVECLATRVRLRCHVRATLSQVVTGDRVLWRRGLDALENRGIIETLQTRTSCFERPDSFGKMKLVAANISRVFIVIAPEPEAHANLIDRYIVAAHAMGVEPVLLLNKADLPCSDALSVRLQHYRDLGYDVLTLSCRTSEGLPALQAYLRDGVSIFVGQSGVGKSSLIQALLPDETIKIGDLSEVIKKGRHTTTHASLYHFPTGGDCIDSPGIREFGLWHLTAADVFDGFKEFAPYAGLCRFRNCNHLSDAGCALTAAAEAGDIAVERLSSFQHIVQTLGAVTVQQAKVAGKATPVSSVVRRSILDNDDVY
jgi:ribosome biogenesis GTPase / thiamine phosphate phosphatase